MEKLSRYCEEFCPIYKVIEEYNSSNEHNIYCNTEMCKHIREVCAMNLEKKVE